MSAALQRWLEARWWQGAPVPAWLAALSSLFGRLAAARRHRQQRTAQRLPVPVVVVGNLTVGGSGKTPVVIAVVEALRAAGFHPGVVSRGHGRRGTRLREVPAGGGDPALFGDEPVLIARRTGAPVLVARDRRAAARALLERHAVDVVVADDGLQHYRLARDIEIVVIDGRRRFGNGRLLPAGPLREPVTRLRQADLVLVNGDRGRGETGFELQAGEPWSLAGGPARALASFAGMPVHAVAGIGDPARFFATLRAAGLELIEHPFPDHHRFVAADLDFGDGLPVLMTEKDAVKCLAFARPEWHALPVTARLPAPAVERILAGLKR